MTFLQSVTLKMSLMVSFFSLLGAIAKLATSFKSQMLINGPRGNDVGVISGGSF